MEYRIIARSWGGAVRKENQDAAVVRHGVLNGKPILLAAVCDGVGSLIDSKRASYMVISHLNKWYDSFISTSKITVLENVLEEIEKVIIEDNLRIIQEKERGKKLGTTLTLLCILGEESAYFHVGDTRLYGLDGDVRQITVDDTLVELQYQKGLISKEEARNSTKKHVLVKCIGATSNLVLSKGRLPKEMHTFLLCSDGLRNRLTWEEIREGLMRTPELEEEQMGMLMSNWIETVVKRGETDNISGILISKALDNTEVLSE